MSNMTHCIDEVRIHQCEYCNKIFMRIGEKGLSCMKNHTSCCHCGETEISKKHYKFIIIALRKG